MLLVLVTGATALILEGSLIDRPFRFALVLIGLYLTGGCANALNQYFERDVDARMKRTRKRRPLPQGLLHPGEALVFAVTIGIVGVAIYALFFNLLTAVLALATILFYSLFYTLYLKPTTYQNIVIGGAAGAMAPVGAWTAATGQMALMPWAIFLIVFFWTPPHFWALALFCKDDYREVGYPMLPVLKGDAETYRQIFIYTVVLVAISLIPLGAGAGAVYGISGGALGAWFIVKAALALVKQRVEQARGIFGYSIIYLFAVCGALIVDKLLA